MERGGLRNLDRRCNNIEVDWNFFDQLRTNCVLIRRDHLVDLCGAATFKEKDRFLVTLEIWLLKMSLKNWFLWCAC